MPTGTCRLCLQQKDLQQSHYMPKALYKRLLQLAKEDGQANANPVLLTPGIAIKTSAQVTDHLLCKGCEGLFSTRGEKWIMEHCWRTGSTFPLRELVQRAAPLGSVAGDAVYPGSTLGTRDIEMVIYFAASVFWRGAAHQWAPIGGSTPVKLDLANHSEDFRLYLLGEAPFPADASLLVNVSSSSDDGANESVLFPWKSSAHRGFDQYRFLIPGVAFRLFVGQVPKELRLLAVTTTPDRPLLFGSPDFILADAKKLVDKAVPKGEFATSP